MPYEPPFERNDAIDTLCMESAEMEAYPGSQNTSDARSEAPNA